MRTKVNGREGDFFGRNLYRLLSFITGSLEFAVDGYVGILIEAGIGFEAWFWLGSAFENTVIMLEETDTPLDAGKRVVVLKGMGKFLSTFDEFAICYASRGPGLWEMVGIELMKALEAGSTADDDMLAVFAAFFDRVHGTAVKIDRFNGFQIAHTAGMVRRNDR